MGTVKEYRIVLPLTVEEYKTGALYSTIRASMDASGGGEGIEILKNEPYTSTTPASASSYGSGSDPLPFGSGQFTHKIIRLSSKLPGWMKTIMPSLKTLALEEKAWNAYPHCKTVYSCDLLGSRFAMEIISMHLDDDRGQQDNLLNCTPEELKIRKVDMVDIAYDELDKSKYKAINDPRLVVSKKTGRGLLQKGWMSTVSPVMCAYKLVRVQFKYWGVQTRVENYIHKVAIREQFMITNRYALTCVDEWLDMSLEDIRKYESDAQAELAALIAPHKTLNSEEEKTLVSSRPQSAAVSPFTPSTHSGAERMPSSSPHPTSTTTYSSLNLDPTSRTFGSGSMTSGQTRNGLGADRDQSVSLTGPASMSSPDAGATDQDTEQAGDHSKLTIVMEEHRTHA